MITWTQLYQEAENKQEVLNEIVKEINVLNYFAKKEILAYCHRRLGEWEQQKILEKKLKERRSVQVQADDFDKMTEEEFMAYWGAK
jgi:hypothetical protein